MAVWACQSGVIPRSPEETLAYFRSAKRGPTLVGRFVCQSVTARADPRHRRDDFAVRSGIRALAGSAIKAAREAISGSMRHSISMGRPRHFDANRNVGGGISSTQLTEDMAFTTQGKFPLVSQANRLISYATLRMIQLEARADEFGENAVG